MNLLVSMAIARPTWSGRTRTLRQQAGFTLIELMVACAIVGILTAIAYPSYRNYVIRGQLVDATNGLANMRANMERYYQDNRTYTGANSPCTNTAVAGLFTFSCTVSSTTAFTLQAIGSGNATGFTYTVDQNNNMATTVAATAPRGWISCTTAWVTKPGGC